MTLIQPKDFEFLQLIEPNSHSLNDETDSTEAYTLCAIDRTEFSLVEQGVWLKESIPTLFDQSQRSVSFRIRTISHNQRRLFEFLELIEVNCFLFNDDSKLRKASPFSPTDLGEFSH